MIYEQLQEHASINNEINYLLNENIIEVTGQSPGKMLSQITEALLLLFDCQEHVMAWNQIISWLFSWVKRFLRCFMGIFIKVSIFQFWRTQSFTGLFVSFFF